MRSNQSRVCEKYDTHTQARTHKAYLSSIENGLHEARTIAQLDEPKLLAALANVVRPTAKHHALSFMGLDVSQLDLYDTRADRLQSISN